jgi:hypothetical protein
MAGVVLPEIGADGVVDDDDEVMRRLAKQKRHPAIPAGGKKSPLR